MATYTALYQPPLGSSWNPWILASRSGYDRPFSSPLPLNWFPARTISLYAEFLNNFICISSSDITALALLGWSMAGATMAYSIGIPTSLSISYTRARGNHGTLGFNQRYYDPALSPRYGYSIGNLFKHQAYFTMKIVGMGWTIGFQNIWLTTPGIMAIESCSNARLRRAYLKQGKVLGIRFGPPDQSGQKKMYVKICEKDIPPPDGLSCPSLTIHTMQGDSPSTENLGGTLNVGWEIESTGGANTYIQEGDFFTLSTPLLLEDPALMHEYGLTKDPYWRTKQQRFEIETDIIGSWVQTIDETLGAVFMAHVSGDKKLVTLPSTEAEAIRNQESMEYGGSPDDAFEGEPSTVRLIMNVCGGPGLQNFCAGNLIGEFAEINGQHYEIVAHPRNDTIAISTTPAEGGARLAAMPSKAKIFQQKFWMTSELFFGGAAVRAFSSFGGQATGGGSGAQWKNFMPDDVTFELDQKEQDEISCKDLIERHIKDVGPGTAIKAYNKFERWKASIGGKQYKIKNLNITKQDVQVEVEGEITNANGIAFVTSDTPYEPVGALGGFSASASFAPAIDQLKTWTIFMQGSYNAGIFRFPQQIPDDSIFSIVSNSFTVYPAAIAGKKSYGLGNPFIYISTQKGVPQGIAATEVPLSGQPFIFFNDPTYNVLAYRTSLDPEWTEEREQGLVRIGHYTLGQTNDDTAFITGVSFSTTGASLAGTYGGGGKAHWITIPNGQYSSECPFFATKITGAGGVISPYIRDKDLLDEPVANGAWLPFEVYPSEGGGKSFFPAYIPVRHSEGLGWVEASEGKLKDLLGGKSVSASSGGSGGSEIQVTPLNRLVYAPGIKDAFALHSGTIGLVYSTELQNWSLGGDTEPITNALCVITSDNCAYDWGSPKLDKPANAVASQADPTGPSSQALEATEWGSPLITLLDFEMVGSLIRSDIFELFCFGYVYEPGEEAYKDINKLSLAMYRVAIPDLMLGETSDIFDTKTGEQIAKYRPSVCSTKFGRFGGNGVAEYLNESFIKIIGNPDVDDAQITGTIDKEIVAPMWMGESIRIFMYSAYYKGIISIVSDNLGEVWQLETEGGEPIMYSRGEGGYPVLASPGVFGQIDSHNLMFYIADNSLLCKRIDLTGEGASTQEKLDKSVPIVVAVDVQEHKCVSTSDRSGRLLVYYLSSQGILTAAVSPDCGDHWETLKNF